MNQASAPNFNIGHKMPKKEEDLFSWADDERQESPKRNGRAQPNRWELDVKPLISSQRWLQLHGLKRNRLKLHQILARIGFKHTDSYVKSLRKPVGSYYGEGLFKQMRTGGGKTYNITVGKETLRDIENNLKQGLNLMRRRQEWLTSGSRKIFGVIQEHCVCIVLDVSTMVQSQFDMFREAICEVLHDQVSQLAKFNLIRAQSDMLMWQDSASPVSDVTIRDAEKWVRQLDRMAEISNTSCTEAVIKACEDDTLEAVYLFTEGDVSESSKELLRQKLKESPVPLHAVSFNATKPSTVTFLKTLAAETGGRFHAFVVKSDYEDDDDIMGKTGGYHLNGAAAGMMSSMRLSQKTRGGLPHGAGVREDVFLVWRELEEARNILADIQTLIANIEESTEPRVDSQALVPVMTKRQEANLSSKDWLRLHGLDASRLTIFHSLASYAFKHIDDVIELQGKPTDTASHDAHQILKLIEAKYCKNFPHIMWKNNQVVHVYVSAELFRTYEHKMKTLLSKIQQRIDWLQQGSREVFGSILEERIYFLIDSSYSMGENLPVLKEKLTQLFQEQLRHKTEFNLVKFESKASAWKPRLEEVNEENLQTAWNWIKLMEPGGSTNTLAALRIALSDPNTEGIYLLTDGRPDQPLHVVLGQIQLRKPVPIHTISFNCNDTEANKFLHQLALDTGGRYHCYTTHGGLPHGPMPYESEDITLLKAELQRGKDDLKRMSDLRAKCVMLDWYYNRKSKKEGTNTDKKIAPRMLSPPPTAPCCIRQKKVKSLPSSSILNNGTSIPDRPSTALGIRSQPTLLEISHKHHRGQFGVNDEEMYQSEMKQLTDGATPENRKKERSRSPKEPSTRPKSSKKHKHRDVKNSVWLKTNGLIARKMTIMDALGPTIIRQRRKYIPILDKHVLSRVFDDVLPIAHVSPRSRKEIRLVNPNGAHLEMYENELKKLLQMYRDRLNGQIWRHLPKAEREKYGSKDAFFYIRNPEYELTDDSSVMDEINAVLEISGWPIARLEIQILLDEIHLGERYLQQSVELRTAAVETALPRNSKKKDQKKKPHNPKKTAKKKRKPPKKVDFALDRRSRKSGSDTDTCHSESDSRYQELVDGMESATSSSDVTEVTESENEEIRTRSNPYNVEEVLRYLSGESVLARSEFDGYYYEGKLMQFLDMRFAHVRFSHGEDQITSTRYILPLSQELPLAALRLGDHVLAKTRSSAKEPIHYIPGIIVGLPGRRRNFPNHYKVLLCDNTKKRALRQTLLKIDETRYKLAIQFIEARLERLGCELEPESVSEEPLSSEEKSDCSSSKKFTEVKEKLTFLHELLNTQTIEIQKLREKEPEKPPTPPPPSIVRIVTHERTTSPIPELEPIRCDTGAQIDFESAPERPPTPLSPSEPETNQEVLARFDDDGWYYRGCVKKVWEDNGSYDVADANNSICHVARHNVILEEEDGKFVIVAQHRVVALHPSYHNSYAPAIVTEVKDHKYHVKFYDGAEAALLQDEVYVISNEKYEEDVAFIDQCEQKWEGQAVVARSDADGQFHLALCKHRIGRSREFTLQWSDGMVGQQYLTHIFGALTRRREFETGDHILAIADHRELVYLPGFVTFVGPESLTVNFCDGTSGDKINPSLSYYLSKDYYEQVVGYYMSLRQEGGTQR